ncbi:sugar phosphate isomerase/epimerase [Polaribacter sp. PL03]|uniref:sugar phosphate isomerase/epimerase family protein n=1 Tax=Polaribacter sp. PL03 TaxID=3088353 RepID=UPI0029CAF0CC|nr:sugar phosphate isomerase/epimerase [Polaribacter sp. PL03]MDX6746619.1 sugar phosphate isomerase/epimerase [Polaribacter sp. PL03]
MLHSKIVHFLLLSIFISQSLFINAQDKSENQLQELSRYIGTWYGADNINDDDLGTNPKVKMTVEPTIGFTNGLQVEVFESRKNEWKTTLVELISYDVVTDKIIAKGINNKNECFIGKGEFYENNSWIMKDENLNGEHISTVNFNFLSSSEVVLKGTDSAGKELWEIKYIKKNKKNKNIGIQLVSVKELMDKNPENTLKQLGRMGYSYIETFVYKEGKFYGYSPKEFRDVVEKNGMRFLGSMTFYNPVNKSEKEIEKWWSKTILDHKKAGVAYLSTSNNNLKNIKSLSELKVFTDYYNLVGKLCEKAGLKFLFHNHKDEFLEVEGKIIYDYFLENTNSKYVSFQSDLYWMHVAGVNPVDYFEKYPKRFISWHVKDYKELGQSGKIDFNKIFLSAEKAGLKYIIAEVEDYTYPTITSVGLAWDYMYYKLLK